MQNAAINNLAFIEFISWLGDLESAATQIIAGAEVAYAARDYEKVRELGGLLNRLNVSPAYAGIGGFFVGLAIQQKGAGDLVTAMNWHEQALKVCPKHYTERALLSIAVIAYRQKDFTTWREICGRLSLSEDLYIAVEARRALAIELSQEGHHRDALLALESLLPFVTRHPKQAEYLNSYAYELCSVGRLVEAKKAISAALRSPMARVNPEFRETEQEISEKLSEQPGKLLAFTPRIDEGRIRREASEYVSRNFLQPQFPLREIQRIRGDVRAIAAAGGR